MGLNKNEKQKNNINDNNIGKTKLNKIIRYYYEELYENFEISEIQARIIDVNIYIDLLENINKRDEYKIYIQTEKGLPSAYIGNISDFFLLCVIHGFLPNIKNIIIKNSDKELNLNEYKKIVFLKRLFHLFFMKGFNFILYNIINDFVNDPFITELFQEKNIMPLTNAEVFSVVKVLEDIKYTGFNLHKYHFNEKLTKLKNSGTFTENIFLEISIKFREEIKEILGYDSTYMKPASFEQDKKEKIDFNRVFTLNLKKNNYREMPIQFTTSFNEKKFKDFEKHFKESGEKEFIYLQAGGKFKNKANDIIEKYKDWITNPENRESQDFNNFPLFINQLNGDADDLVILYFYLHKILKNNKSGKISTIKGDIGGIDFSKTKIEEDNYSNDKSIIKKQYIIIIGKKKLGKITLFKKK